VTPYSHASKYWYAYGPAGLGPKQAGGIPR
jgi:hypothetical protein